MQDSPHPLPDPTEPHRSAALAELRICCQEYAQTGAIHPRNARKIDEQLPFPPRHEALQLAAEPLGFGSPEDLSRDLEHGDVAHSTDGDVHGDLRRGV